MNRFVNKLTALLLASILLSLFVATSSANNMNIVETARAAGQFDILVAALEATGLDEVLSDEEGKFTVFAPTDAAFEALGQDTIDALLDDPETLSDILLYHVVVDWELDANGVLGRAGKTILMANGDRADVTLQDGDLFIDDAKITVTDIQASNGIIHVIDAVLMPPEEPKNIVETAREAGQFNTLVAALEATGLDAVLSDEDGKFTVFAPTDDAFAALGQDTIDALLNDPETLSDILLYHVVVDWLLDANGVLGRVDKSILMANGDRAPVTQQGDALFINGAQIVVTNIEASNGIIHVIDAVMMPPKNIVETARDAGQFDTLVAALEATGLDATLSDEDGKFTVFAPTDDAFAALGQDVIDDLLNDPETLSDILLYHVVVDWELDANGVLGRVGKTILMANGDRAPVTQQGDALFIDGAQIIATDIETTNGIIHVIDAVLIPPEDE